MNFKDEQRLAMTKPFIELADPSAGSGLSNKRPRDEGRFEGSAIVFYERDRHDIRDSLYSCRLVEACDD